MVKWDTLLRKDANVILINYPDLFTWFTKNTDNGIIQNRQKGKPCRGADIAFVFLFRQYAQEQPQWSDGTSESTFSWFPTCENRYPPIRWGKTTATDWVHAHGTESTTPPASHQVKACKKNSLLEFITSLKVRNANTAIDAKNSSSCRLFGSMVLASR